MSKAHGVWKSGDGVAEKHYLKTLQLKVMIANAGFIATNNSYYMATIGVQDISCIGNVAI
jgi:hypothetical protein